MGTFVISGSSSGIGATTAALLRGRGNRVIGLDLKDADVIGDLSHAEGRAKAIAAIKALLGEDRIDGIVPCAGVAGLTDVDPALVVSVNYFGAIGLVDGLRDVMRHQASVVMLSSNSVTCQPGWPGDWAAACLAGDEAAAREKVKGGEAVQAYPATKAALAAWVRRECVARAKEGTRINAVAPGLIATPMTKALRDDPVLGVFADLYPTALDRPGRPGEVAAVIEFLLSPASSLMVGSIVVIDGGCDAIVNPTPTLAAGVSLA